MREDLSSNISMQSNGETKQQLILMMQQEKVPAADVQQQGAGLFGDLECDQDCFLGSRSTSCKNELQDAVLR